MEERARSCLLRHRDTLQQDIKASYLMDHMVSDNVLTHDEEEKVRAKPTRKEQAVTLIDLVLQKDNRAYISVYNALIRESYGDLASLLQPDLPLISPEAQKSFSDGGTPYVNTTLIEGGVPQRPVVFVTRPPLVNQIREKLYRLQDTTGWVTVFGMAGSGKSVLAAEAVRDEAVIKECFPGGVHWLSIGQLELPGLLVKIQSLCFRLEQTLDSSSQRPPNSIEEAKDRLRYLMLYKYPRSLLILDDIWDGAVLKAFDVQCRVLLTTRDRSLVDSVGGQRFEVHVESGLGHKKALEVLALYVNKKPEDLPDQAYSIVRECKCSPLVVSLIGALLHDFPDRWDYYLRQLKMKQFRRIRKSSSYDYEALDQAMDASITVLQEDYQELYKDFTVVKKDVKVPAKVLSIIWNLELEEVEDMLQEFVNKSLLFRDCTHRPYLYYLHDLQLDFLVEQNRSRLQELHSKVVRQYQQFYREGPPISGDQECLYWFRYLTYHMANAGLTQELYTLIFSLDWIKTKAQLMGPVSVINDYVEHGAILENSEVCKQFLEFLSVNGHHLEQKPFPDVVQLGLSQPVSSRVYQEAQLLAQQQTSSGALYLDWVNKSSLESLSRLVIKPLQGFIYYACFSRDGLKIASCGSDNTLQVFRVTSGEKLLDFRAHEDEVLCCAFSPDDRQIATCSSDKKVKLWNAEKGTLIRTFDEEHEEQVNHCQFTNTRRRILLATCSNDSVYNMKLWNPNRQSSQNTLFGHMEPVSHCCFSPDDTYLSTSSSDGTLKLWEVSSANEWKSINVQGILDEDEETETIVKCSSWSADCRRIFCAARNAVFLWDVEAKKKKADCRGHLSSVHCVRFSPDGALLLSSSSDQTFRLWETEKIHTSSAVSLKRDLDVLFDDRDVIIVAPDNKNKLQTDGFDAQIQYVGSRWLSRASSGVLELPSGKVLHVLSGHTKTVLHCQFNADGHTLITSSEDATLRVHLPSLFSPSFMQRGVNETVLRAWSGSSFFTAEKIQDIVCHQGSILSCDASPDGHLFATTSTDKTAKLWSLQSWRKLHELIGHQDCIRSCRFSWNSSRLATGDDYGEIRLWCVLDGSLLKICSSSRKDSMDSLHGGWVTDLHFSPDNKVLVSTGGYVKWWDVEKGKALQTFYTTGANLKGIHVSPDFGTFVTIDSIGILYILRKM
uniref:Apoptotic peptidase activating factor 1 n=1 Tax=Scleropages formosus TaxID=113540 RepID=A0A8C9VDI5_SCLFO